MMDGMKPRIVSCCSRREATCELFKRYLALIPENTPDHLAHNNRLSLENLRWICREVINDDGGLPIDKISRWIGFVQGCLAMREIIDSDTERNFSRPLFHKAYMEDGIEIPEKRERKTL